MIVLHKVFHFCAAHRYWNPAWTPEANEAAFGEDIHLHGHNYKLIISVTGEVDDRLAGITRDRLISYSYS